MSASESLPEAHALTAATGVADRLQSSSVTALETQKRVEALLSGERRRLEMIANGASLNDVLEDLCATIDAEIPDVISTVLVMDPAGKQLWPAAGRRVPRAWAQVISPLPVGPEVGSCGTAAFRKELVIAEDIATDPLWLGTPASSDISGATYRDLALRHGLRAAWSQPLVSRNHEVLGTLAMYYPQPRRPTDADLQLICAAGHVAVVAVEGERSQAALTRAFEELEKSAARLRETLDTIPVLAWSSRPDGFKEFFNRRWYDYTGLSPEEALGWGWKATIHPADLEQVKDTWIKLIASGEPGELEGRLRRSDGEYRWFLSRAQPFRDEKGNLVNWYGTDTDIEDRRRAEEKLRQDEQELRQIVDAIPEVILVLSREGRTLYANQATLDFTGFSIDEVMAPDFRLRAFHPEDNERVREERTRLLAGRVPFTLEQRLRRNDGHYRWCLTRYKPVCDQDGQVLRWYATGTDIDERVRAEERIRSENQALCEEIDRSAMFEEIVGSSAPLRRVLAQVAKVAGADSTVLILGETGTGKELIARAIHRRSRRSNRAFIRVNCAAIPPALIASELFGHEKGAFTGALQRRLGRFEMADGGTLFLDEVGELPAETQVALLRVLQEREFERLGGTHPIAVDVRVLAATNRDLKAALTRGAFRQDLYYRLAVFPIEVPSLRERADDIPLLVKYLVDRYARRAGKQIRTVKRTTLDLFQAYDWPGNIRELQNVVERAVILCEEETFSIDETWLKGETPRVSRAASLAGTLADREREMIEAALAACRGRTSGPSGAAARLGMPRQTLDSKIKALQIDKLRFRAM